MYTIPKPLWKRPLLTQIALLLLASSALWFCAESLSGSFLVGGLIQIVPQAWFAQQAFKHTGARQTPAVVRAMYRGEAGKIVLTAVLFAIVLTTCKQMNYSVLFAAFTLMIPLQWFLNARALQR
jgi:ATP synthase protein I